MKPKAVFWFLVSLGMLSFFWFSMRVVAAWLSPVAALISAGIYHSICWQKAERHHDNFYRWFSDVFLYEFGGLLIYVALAMIIEAAPARTAVICAIWATFAVVRIFRSANKMLV